MAAIYRKDKVMKIVAFNSFHNTRKDLTVRADRISAKTVAQLNKALCVEGCICESTRFYEKEIFERFSEPKSLDFFYVPDGSIVFF